MIHRPSHTSPLKHSPFGCLQGLLDHQDSPPSKLVDHASQGKEKMLRDHRSGEQLFLEAMEGVKPITRDPADKVSMGGSPVKGPRYLPEDEALSGLARLVRYGEGFRVSDTPEYMEGTGYHVHRKFAQRLHRGTYSIQAHIDLHGLSVKAAKESFESFLKASVHSGKRAVLIIHGRGLSSPGEPILKNKIREWLSQSYWLKRIIAYTSAQPFDGGAGATYVLLRSRPVSARSKKTIAGI